jgi:signal transduction histidine kinase
MSQIKPSYVFHHNLFGKLRNLEVAILMLTGLLEALLTPLAGPVTLSSTLLASLYLMCIVAVLTYYPPLTGAVWLRLFYMLTEVTLVFLASIFGVYRLFPLLFIIIVAKGALMLPLRGLFTLLIATATMHALGSQLRPLILHEQLPLPWQSESLPYLFVVKSEAEIFMIVALVLVAIMARTLISEQESRLQVEQLAKEVETLAVYQERTRIAREIHDALGHTLTSLNIQLEVARKLANRDAAKSNEALDSAKQLASQSLNDVRRALNMIMPSRADAEFDLNEALPVLVRQVEQNQPIKVTLDLDEIRLPSIKSHHVYCIVRECLTNIQRHAKATNIGIALKLAADKILVEVNDDGKGFDPLEASSGFGISGMKERVEHLGGTLAIQSSPGVGTKVQVSVPC